MKKTETKGLALSILAALGIIVLGFIAFMAWVFFWLIVLCNSEGTGCKYDNISYPVIIIIVIVDLFFVIRQFTKKSK